MPQIRCPHCRTAFSVAPEQQGQVIACSHCRATLPVPPATAQIQLPDMRLDPAAAAPPAPPALPRVEAIKEPATDLRAVRVERTTWDEFISRSAAFRREMERFAADKPPELEHLGIAPLPGVLPHEADDLGHPLASL